jgi:hypothetical protein
MTKPIHPGADMRHHHDPHARLASVQSSWHTARVAIARWRAEGRAADASPSPQSRWHATAQRDFCAWLDAGGFTQAETADATPAPTRPELSCLHCE